MLIFTHAPRWETWCDCFLKYTFVEISVDFFTKVLFKSENCCKFALKSSKFMNYE